MDRLPYHHRGSVRADEKRDRELEKLRRTLPERQVQAVARNDFDVLTYTTFEECYRRDPTRRRVTCSRRNPQPSLCCASR